MHAAPAVPRAVREALVSWEHSADYPLPKSKDWTAAGGGGGFVKTYKLGEEHAFLADHVVDGRILMPVGCMGLSSALDVGPAPHFALSMRPLDTRKLHCQKARKKGMLSGCKGVLICKLQIALPSRALCRGRARCPCKAHADPVPARFCYESNCTCDGDAVP